MAKEIGKGMLALQDRVAGRIMRANATQERTSVKLFRMRDDFKLAALKAANKEGVSLESFIRLAMAERMKWEGEI